MVMSDQSYSGSHNIVFVLSISYLFLGLAGIVVLGIHITKKTWIITLIWPFSALINILLNIWLIPVHNRMGAAMATLFSVIVITISYFYAVHRIYPVKFDYLSFVKMLLLLLVFNYLGSLVSFGLLPSILIKTFIILLFLVALYFSGVFSKIELQQARNYLLGLRNLD
jgi:O-antigen/teichoic acid export membrane protein